MNIKDQTSFNNTVRKFNIYGITKYKNALRYRPPESEKHFMAKARMAYLINKAGFTYVTEFPIPGRTGHNIFDLCIIDYRTESLIGVEIRETETDKQTSKKIERLNKDIVLIPLGVHEAMQIKSAEDIL